MSQCSLVVVIVIAIYGLSNPAKGVKKDWTYKLEQVNTNTTNPDILQIPLRTVRIGPGVYGVKGSFLIGVDAGDDFLLEGRLSRSASGSSQYSPTPFSIPQCTLSTFMNKYYKNFFMGNVIDCSTLPQFEDEWSPPLKKGEYTLNSCEITTDNFPAHMSPGWYKFNIIITRPSLVAVIEAIVKIDAAYM